jgi:hypothetical protein
MRWLPSGADVGQVLTRAPGECLTASADAEKAYEVELGRAAFRTPLILGGQAARAGVACETCHRSGRTNPDFDFPGVSGAPGTADVTTPVLSSHRGDDVFDPRPIPDLSGPRSALKVDQDPAAGKLEAFIHGIITQEFDGPEPTPAVLEGLAAYVRALSPAACPAAPWRPMTPEGAVEDVRRAVRAAAAALARGDAPSVIVMLEAARSRLGDLAERYPGPELEKQRGALASSSRDLDAIEADVRRESPAADGALSRWLVESDAWSRQVEAAEPESLYDPHRLAKAAADWEKNR